jgi:hypothetical protein
MEKENSQSEDISWEQILLALIVIVLLIIAYLLFSYGEYLECVKPYEILSNYYQKEDARIVIGNWTPSELASQCGFPKNILP